jgi:hypothetical protein
VLLSTVFGGFKTTFKDRAVTGGRKVISHLPHLWRSPRSNHRQP